MSNRTLTNGGAVDQTVFVRNDQKSDVIAAPPPHLPSIIADIRRAHRDRKFAMAVRISIENMLGSFLRAQSGWRKDLPKAQRAAIKKKALAAIATGKKIIKREEKLAASALSGAKPRATPKPLAGETDQFFTTYGGHIIGTLRGLTINCAMEDSSASEMGRLARTLPVAPWFLKNIFSTSALQLGVIIGECGDLTTWPDGNKMTVSQMRKRLGLAPYTKDGVTRSGAGWRRKGGLSKDDWIGAGYNQERRSLMYVIGDLLVKKKGPYRDIYLKRKKDELAKAAARGLTVRPSKDIPKGSESEFISKKQIHLMAQRYMEQRVAKDVFLAWRRANDSTRPVDALPAATLSAQAERSATYGAITKTELPSATYAAVKAVRGGHAALDAQKADASPLSSAKAEQPRARRRVKPLCDLPGATNSGRPERRVAKMNVKPNRTLLRASLKPVAAKAAKRRTKIALKPILRVSAATHSNAG